MIMNIIKSNQIKRIKVCLMVIVVLIKINSINKLMFNSNNNR